MIEKIDKCNGCAGSGVLQHPAWAHYFDEHKTTLDREYLVAWFAKNWNFSTIPPDLACCWFCDGAGKIVSKVNLIDALRDIGVSGNYVPAGWGVDS